MLADSRPIHTREMGMALQLSILSLALLVAAAMAFTRQRAAVLVACGGLFMPVAAAATVAVYWAAPEVAVALLAIGLVLPAVGLALFAIDRVWAPFCLEMTYAGLLCWLAWPALVAADFLGLVLLR
jgi:hypothetical protein